MTRRRHPRVATAAVTLAVQLIATSLIAISACVDRPHTHGNRAALDCPMHHAPLPAGTTSGAHAHDHHHSSHPVHDESSGIRCRCSADPLALLAGTSAVVTDRIAISIPVSIASRLSPFHEAPLDLRAAPIAPPPRARS